MKSWRVVPELSLRMNMPALKVLIVIGTRPEAIKLAPVVLEFRRRGSAFSCFVCATGQHREMVDQVLPVFGIQPDHDLGLMLPAQRSEERRVGKEC